MAVDFLVVDFVVVASEAVFEAAAVVLEVVFGVAVGHQVDHLEERGREEQQQVVVVVGLILIEIVILDDTTTGDLGIGDGGILLGLDITIDHGITHQYMLGAV